MIVADESEKCWSGGGLTIECLEPHRRWKIAFQGLLRYYHITAQDGGGEFLGYLLKTLVLENEISSQACQRPAASC